MVRFNTIVSSYDKNPQMQEPHINGSIRKVGHVRTVWQAVPAAHGAHWFGPAKEVEGVPSKDDKNVKDPASKYPFFDCGESR
mmetsp:Transcript_20760/g.45001  ORF Transcript_20760/g.45001 Transcript_20760/m.45001 type:complete len:82 (-) Transcript_20760:46-291(-)